MGSGLLRFVPVAGRFSLTGRHPGSGTCMGKPAHGIMIRRQGYTDRAWRRAVEPAGRPAGPGRDPQLCARLAVGRPRQWPRQLHGWCASMFKVFHGVARRLDALQPDRTAALHGLDTELVAPAASNTCSSLLCDPARLPKPATQQCLLSSTAVCMQCRAACNDTHKIWKTCSPPAQGHMRFRSRSASSGPTSTTFHSILR